jgi:hypothetical protein
VLHVAAQHVQQHAAAVPHTLQLTPASQRHDSTVTSTFTSQGSITTSAQQRQLGRGCPQPLVQPMQGPLPLPLLLLQQQQLWPAQQYHLQQQQQYYSHHQHHHLQHQQQLRCYHRATHTARTLTTKLLQQDSWQVSSTQQENRLGWTEVQLQLHSHNIDGCTCSAIDPRLLLQQKTIHCTDPERLLSHLNALCHPCSLS